MTSNRSTPSTNIRTYRKTSNFDPKFSLYENYTYYENRRLQVRERTAWGSWPSQSDIELYGECLSPEKSDDEEQRWPWRKYPETTSGPVREGGYTGNELIELRGEDMLKTCYTPLTDPAANIRPASWQLASPMWKPQYEVATKSRVKCMPWWAQPVTENLQPAASRDIQMCESQKWQRLLEKMRQGRELQTSKLRGY